MGDAEAIVVGSGPNGLVAAIALAQAGWSVSVLEAGPRPGGGTRSEELTLPGVVHDVCSAIHPLGLASPAFRAMPLGEHGLEWVQPEVPLAHPLDGGRAALLHRSLAETADGLAADGRSYRNLFGPFVRSGFDLTDDILSPFTLPQRHPLALAQFGVIGVQPATRIDRLRFETEEAGGLLAGLAAHSMLPLGSLGTAGFAMVLGGLGHMVGWPMARGGSQSIADALVHLLESLGGSVVCDSAVTSLDDLPPAEAVLLDLTPRQVLSVAGHRLPARYSRRLRRYRYGPGVFKIDWALAGPIPWSNTEAARAATVHLGGSMSEIAASEREMARGGHPERPFVLLAQQSLFDPSRAPNGIQTAWAYCHVPNGSTFDMTERVERQIERFAPGFRDLVLDRHTMGPAAAQSHNANYVGGDINGGAADLRQMVIRPTPGLHPWATPVDGLYLCSSSTPPGGGVHGMCGWHAAAEVLRRQPLGG